MTRPPDRLTTLPTELLAGVLELLDAFTLVACMLACRRLKILIDNTTSLKYILALEASGMEDGQNSTLSLVERGFLVAVEPHFVHIWQIPSQLRGVEARPLRLAFPSDEVFRVLIEPSEDLLLMFCVERILMTRRAWGPIDIIRIEMRSASSGLPHPKPQDFDIDLDYGPFPDVLGKYTSGFSDASGGGSRQLAHGKHDGASMVYDNSTCFKEAEWGIHPCLLEDGYVLMLEDLDLTGDARAVLAVYDCLATEGEEELAPEDQILSLLFPPFRDGIRYYTSTLSALPGGTRGNPHKGHFFSSHSEVRLLHGTLSFWFKSALLDLEFIILSSVVTKYISASRASSKDTGPEPLRVPWNVWAPGNILVRPRIPSGSSLAETGCGCRASLESRDADRNDDRAHREGMAIR
ncbi:hypothetical protein OF83DRAFT_1085362 [Amylostereum chailletii]|nr:hypothetical protein OF83DRAFT_1085362 [Amylostereum chailletii]